MDKPPPLAIYLHWPFCKSKCPYCDFNSHMRDGVNIAAWQQAYLDELRYYHERTGERRITSIFFGGGTPSLMPPALVSALLEEIGTLWEMDAACEITLEANPTSVEAANFAALAQAGVNRLSLGVQSLRPDALQFLGREHSVDEARQAIALAAQHFPRYSFDLIYAHPGQTPERWETELREALALAGDHLSLYQLTIEPGTAFFHAVARGELTEIDADSAAELYRLTGDILAEHGMTAYEISNYAVPGGESRHNLTYWRYGDYLGIGPGAHGRSVLFAPANSPDPASSSPNTAQKTATTAIRSPEKWLEAVQLQGHGIETEEALTPHTQATEALLMGLRLEEGVPYARLEKLARAPIENVLDSEAMQRLSQQGLLHRDATQLRATPAGQLLLDHILAEISR